MSRSTSSISGLSSQSIRVAVVSDDPELCRRLFGGGWADHIDLRAVFHNHPAERRALRLTQPDIVVIDCKTTDALRVCADVTSTGRTQVVMIDVPESGDAAADALTAGARGVVYSKQPLTD